jgi:NADH:ubiquinone oxidoreductase subunit F (NADH-binding)
VLIGGYGGNWLPHAVAESVPLAPADLSAAGASLGIAAVRFFPTDQCGIAETARILRYLAAESARQCGPCMFGLPAIAKDFLALARGGPAAATVAKQLRRRLPVLSGRGACAHPDGAARLAASALRTFADDLHRHLDQRPCAARPQHTRRARGQARVPETQWSP